MSFQAEISNERGRFKILRDGIELTRSEGVRIKENSNKSESFFFLFEERVPTTSNFSTKSLFSFICIFIKIVMHHFHKSLDR